MVALLLLGWICLRGFGAGWKLFLAASLLSRWPVYVRSGEWFYDVWTVYTAGPVSRRGLRLGMAVIPRLVLVSYS